MSKRTASAGGAVAEKMLFYTEWANAPIYQQLLSERGVPLVTPEEVGDAWGDITMFVGWNPPPGLLSKCSGLRAAMSLGAGVDHILAEGQVPDRVPILRIVDPLMAQRMATWVAWGVISWQRCFEAYGAAQRQARWDTSIEARSNRDNGDVRVGVMGLGLMGRATADLLLAMNYQVSGWSRTAKEAQGITCYWGEEQLQEFVSKQDVLVCLLPLTPTTEGILNSQLLGWLPRGSAIINGARGRHLNEADLLNALDLGQVTFALLDVFQSEPLPADNPLWSHPGVRITPHVASMTTLQNAADQVAANWHSIASGHGPLRRNEVDRAQGY